MSSIARAAGRGVLTSSAGQLWRMVLQVASVVILARLLTPRDFGLVAMVLAIIGVGELFRDLGLSTAATQAKTLSLQQRDNLFWLNTALGTCMMLLTLAAAPVISAFYGEPAVLPIALALAPTFLITGIATQYRVQLVRKLRFTAVTASDVVPSTVALVVGAALAWQGAGYWALVGQQLLSGILGLAILLGTSRWLPGRFRRGAAIRPMVQLGGWFFLSSLLNYASTNADSVLIGKHFGTTALGQYNRGVQLVRQPMRQLQSALSTVAVPVLSQHSRDPRHMVSMTTHFQMLGGYAMALAGAVLVGSSHDVVTLALGPGWSGAAPLLALLAGGAVLRTVTQAVSWLYVVTGHGRELTYYSVFSATSTICLIFAGTRWGPEGVALAVAAAPLMTYVVGLPVVGRVAGLEVRPLALSGARIMSTFAAATAASYVANEAISSDHPILGIGVAAIGAAAGAGLCLASPWGRQDVRRTWPLVRHVLSRS